MCARWLNTCTAQPATRLRATWRARGDLIRDVISQQARRARGPTTLRRGGRVRWLRRRRRSVDSEDYSTWVEHISSVLGLEAIGWMFARGTPSPPRPNRDRRTPLPAWAGPRGAGSGRRAPLSAWAVVGTHRCPLGPGRAIRAVAGARLSPYNYYCI
jgi:hypothetical protein